MNAAISIRFLFFAIIAFFVNSNTHAASADSNSISFDIRFDNESFHYFNTPNGTGKFVVLSGTPRYEAVVVRKLPDDGSSVWLSKDEIDQATWKPYDGIIQMNLGPEDGRYEVYFALKGADSNVAATWFGTSVTLSQKKPGVVITNPTSGVVTQPYLQLQGYSPKQLENIKYDVFNQSGEKIASNGDGFVTDQYFDRQLFDYTTNYFQCYDVKLDTGLNVITLHLTDAAGNETTTNLNVTLDYSQATKPTIQLIWPQDGMDICDHSFTLRGQTEDASSIISASIKDTNENTNNIMGEVERTGRLWVENIPLHDGTNRLALTVQNSAGLSSVTNINLVYSSFVLVIDSIKGDLWVPPVTVTGHESDATYPVWVNGVKAVVSTNSDGTGKWVARNVPVTAGGVASFDVHAYEPHEIQPDGYYGNGTPAIVKSATGTVTNNFSPTKLATLAVKPSIASPLQTIFLSIAQSNSILYFTWNTVSNQTYQLQYKTDLSSTNWNDLGEKITATSNSASATDAVGSDAHRFYRVRLLSQ